MGKIDCSECGSEHEFTKKQELELKRNGQTNYFCPKHKVTVTTTMVDIRFS